MVGSGVAQSATKLELAELNLRSAKLGKRAVRSDGQLHPAGQGGSSEKPSTSVEIPTLDDDILTAVRALSHYPQRRKVAANEAQQAENALANKNRNELATSLTQHDD